MNRATKALWKRRLTYRLRRVSHWRAKGNIPKVNHWLKRVTEARVKLGHPTLQKLKGVDVSGHNGAIDWKLVKAGGMDYAFCKTSEGADWKDPSWTRARVGGMRAAGVKVGCYHFMRPKAGRSGAVEAKFFIRQAKAMGWGKPGDLRLVLDFEATTLSPVMTVKYLIEAVDAIKAATGKAPIIYTGGPFWQEATRNCRLNFGCPLWLAAYVKDPDKYLPVAWERWDIWQHTDRGSVRGVASDNVDQNIAKRLPLV